LKRAVPVAGGPCLWQAGRACGRRAVPVAGRPCLWQASVRVGVDSQRRLLSLCLYLVLLLVHQKISQLPAFYVSLVLYLPARQAGLNTIHSSVASDLPAAGKNDFSGICCGLL